MLWVCWLVKCKTALRWWFDRFGCSFRTDHPVVGSQPLICWWLEVLLYEVLTWEGKPQRSLWQIVFAHAIVCTKCAAPRDMTSGPMVGARRGLGRCLVCFQPASHRQGMLWLGHMFAEARCWTWPGQRTLPTLCRIFMRTAAGIGYNPVKGNLRELWARISPIKSAQTTTYFWVAHGQKTLQGLICFSSCLAAIAMRLSGLEGNI